MLGGRAARQRLVKRQAEATTVPDYKILDVVCFSERRWETKVVPLRVLQESVAGEVHQTLHRSTDVLAVRDCGSLIAVARRGVNVAP